jgi:hypothetical protein
LNMANDRDYGFVVPLLPDRVGEARKFWKEANAELAGELDRYMRAIGQTRLLECLQTLPGGKFLVTYVREAADPGTTFAGSRKLDTPAARHVREAFLRFTGFDFTAPENAPRVEKLRAWEDEERKTPAQRHSTFAVPVLPGKTDAVRQFFAVVREEKDVEEAPVFRYQTVARMASFLQQRPEGDYLVEYVESDLPLGEVMRMGLGSGRPISDFIRNGFGAFSALPLPLAPEIEVLFDWDARAGNRTAAEQTARA